jgi:hypothetical protein
MEFAEAVERVGAELAGILDEVRHTREEVVGPEQDVLTDVLNFASTVAMDRKLLGHTPADAFERGLSLLSSADKRMFVLRNVLEAMKRGDDPEATLRRYKKLGLLRAPERPEAPEPATRLEVERFQSGTARACLWGSKQVKRIAAAVGILSMAAFRAVPNLAKGKMGITLVGGIPCPNFEFSGEAEMSISELFDRVSSAYKEAEV